MKLFFGLLLIPAVAYGGSINKCVDADGHVTYSDIPCASSSTTKGQVKPPPAPDLSEARRIQLETQRMEARSKVAGTRIKLDEIDREYKGKIQEIDEEYCQDMARIKNPYTSNDPWEKHKTDSSRQKYTESCLSRR